MDLEAIEHYALKVWRYKQGEVVALMIHLGDRLGLYRALVGKGPMTPADLAADTGLSERWLREWLLSQAAADLLDHDEGRFSLSDAGVMVLAEEERSPFFAAGAFVASDVAATADRLADAFASGRGFDYDAIGEAALTLTERTTAPVIKHLLVPVVFRQIPELVERLTAGATVMDVGCGAGVAVRTVAEAYPASEVHGLDPSRLAIERAEEHRRPNTRFVNGYARDLPTEPTYDLVMALDCIHDMSRPDLALAAMRRTIADDGVLLIKDLKSGPDFEQNRRNPLLAMMYGTSVIACLASGLADGDGMGLGNQGFHPDRAREMVEAAGFSSIRILDVPDPANFYYEVRP